MDFSARLESTIPIVIVIIDYVESIVVFLQSDEISFEKESGSILFTTSSEGSPECVEVHVRDDHLIEDMETAIVEVDLESLAANDVIENDQVTIVIKDNDGKNKLE